MDRSLDEWIHDLDLYALESNIVHYSNVYLLNNS